MGEIGRGAQYRDGSKEVFLNGGEQKWEGIIEEIQGRHQGIRAQDGTARFSTLERIGKTTGRRGSLRNREE